MFCRTYLQGKRTVIQMLGKIIYISVYCYKLEFLFQLLLCFHSSSAGLPSTPSAWCLSWSLSMADGLKHFSLLSTFSSSPQVSLILQFQKFHFINVQGFSTTSTLPWTLYYILWCPKDSGVGFLTSNKNCSVDYSTSPPDITQMTWGQGNKTCHREDQGWVLFFILITLRPVIN